MGTGICNVNCITLSMDNYYRVHAMYPYTCITTCYDKTYQNIITSRADDINLFLSKRVDKWKSPTAATQKFRNFPP